MGENSSDTSKKKFLSKYFFWLLIEKKENKLMNGVSIT